MLPFVGCANIGVFGIRKEQTMDREIEGMVKVMCGVRKNFKSCKSCKSANPNTKAYCRIEHYAVLLCKNDYRKSTDVAREIIDLLREVQNDLQARDEFREASAIRYAIGQIETKYESEGADDGRI
jgi:hypothetical protein